MKNIVLIMGCIFYSYGLFGQFGKTYGKDVIHLSYNYFGEKNREKFKNPDYKNSIFFIIEKIINKDQYDEFKAICDEKNPVVVKDSDYLKKTIIGFKEFIEKADQIRNKNISKDHFTIITNDKIFKQIFLYEKTKEGLIYRYAVFWIEIICRLII